MTYTAQEVAELVFEQIYKHHGVPRAIISDRDSLFTSLFWSHLYKAIGSQLKMSSAYHPETDGATGHANRTIVQMLRQCIGENQRDWIVKLPAIKFAINSARSESTGYALFFLNTGRMPRPMVWNSALKTEYPGVRVFAQHLKTALIAAHDSVLAARVKQMHTANKRQQASPFEKGDLIYLSTKTCHSQKDWLESGYPSMQVHTSSQKTSGTIPIKWIFQRVCGREESTMYSMHL